MIEQIKAYLSLTAEELKEPVILKKKQDVFFLVLNTKANSFTKDFVRLIHTKIDIVDANDGPTALMTVSLSKIFSGGLDLKFTSNLQKHDQIYFVLEFIGLLGRLSVVPYPTIALVKGAAIAGGCMFAFTHDFIFVAGDGVFCANQAELGIHLPPGMMQVLKKKHNSNITLRDMVVFSKRFAAKQALSIGMIDGIYPQNDALEKIFELAQKSSSYGQNKLNMKKIKMQLHKTLVDGCFNKQLAPGVVGQIEMVKLPKL